LNSDNVCYSVLRVFPSSMVSSCLAPGREKRHARQQFLIVLSVTVETEGQSELQTGH